jgi:predicted ester cyclase
VTEANKAVVRRLIAEGDKVVSRLTCSAAHLGAWLGQAPTGRRFERVDEVWILGFRDVGQGVASLAHWRLATW